MNFVGHLIILMFTITAMLIERHDAVAGTIVYKFTGVVTTVDDTGGSLTGLVSAGTTYSGIFTFDTSLIDSLPGDASVGFYQMSLPPGGFSIEMGGTSFYSKPAQLGSVTVYNDQFNLRDRLQLQTQPASPDINLVPGAGAIGLNLWDFT